MSKNIKNDLKRIRLGTCFNHWTRDILANVTAFNLEKLNDKHLVKTNAGKQVFSLVASSDNNSNYHSDFFGSQTKAEVGFMKWSLGVGFNVENSTSALNEHSELRCQVSNRYIGQNMELLNLTPDASKVYYNSLMPGIKKAYKTFCEEEDIHKKLASYFNFIKHYGTGFISRLFLEAGSIANISIESNSTATSESKKYGINGAVSVGNLGIANATDWGKTVKKAGIKGTLKVTVETNPSNSPSSEWAHEIFTTFLNKGLETLTETASFADLPEVEYTPLPAYTDKKEPTDDEEPYNKHEKKVDESIKQQIMDDNDFEGTWEEYVAEEAIKQAVETKLKNVIKEGNEIEKEDFIIKKDNPIYELVKSPIETDINNVDEGFWNVDEGSWDLGGYTPSDFIYTPWEAIFPTFNAIKVIFGQNINLSKLITFQMSRVQFGQFLQFASIAFKDIGNHDLPIQTDANIYNKVVDKYSEELIGLLQGGITNSDYVKFVKQFKERLLSESHFDSIANYELFYEQYAYIQQCPFGLLLHNYKKNIDPHGKTVYEADINTVLTEIKISDGKQLPVFKRITNFHQQLKEALRIYLLPSHDKYKGVLFYLCFYQNGKFVQLEDLPLGNGIQYNKSIRECDLIESRKKFKNKFVFDNKHSLLPTHVDFENADLKNVALRGNRPMFQNFPFDLAANFSK